MAVYKFFPTKDTFITSDIPEGNNGKDEIVELNSDTVGGGKERVSRILTTFNMVKIKDTLTKLNAPLNEVEGELVYYLAEAHQAPIDIIIETFPIYIQEEVGTWEQGVGKYLDIPINKTGVSWKFINAKKDPWLVGTLPEGVIQSDSQEIGGGTWIEEYEGDPVKGVQTFNLDERLDIRNDVTLAIRNILIDQLPNNGFITKLGDTIEFDPNYRVSLKYFSRDTNTIYPPCLTLKWDDYINNPGELEEITTSETEIFINNNKNKYTEESVNKFRLTVRPTYPTRVLSSKSLYLKNFKLPEGALWGIKDEDTQEMIIPFDEDYTKVSCDEKGMHFTVYMDGLQPERYYRILIKTEIDGSTLIGDSLNNVFKVVRNG